MIIGEYEGYTITVSNPDVIKKVKKSWLGFIVDDLERCNNEKEERNSSNNNSDDNSFYNSLCNA